VLVARVCDGGHPPMIMKSTRCRKHFENCLKSFLSGYIRSLRSRERPRVPNTSCNLRSEKRKAAVPCVEGARSSPKFSRQNRLGADRSLIITLAVGACKLVDIYGGDKKAATNSLQNFQDFFVNLKANEVAPASSVRPGEHFAGDLEPRSRRLFRRTREI